MFTKRTDLAIEAHELWQESAGKTTRLAGVKATEKKIQGYPVAQVDILDREGEAALGKPAGSYRTLDLTAFWQRGDGFFDRAVQAAGQQLRELLPEQGGCRVTVYEGKYHMVKRMLAGCGTPVSQLHRLSIGALTLDPALSPGAYRELQPAEAMLVFSLPAS